MADAEAPHRRTVSPETQRLYALDWAVFEAWCTEQGQGALPADPATVAAFLAAGGQSLSAGALGRRAAAIGDRHRQRGLASPVKDPAVKAVLRDARRTATPRRVPPQRPNTLISMAARCPRDLAGLRDRALLLLAAQGLSRAALVGLDVEHLRPCCMDPVLVAGGPVAAHIRKPCHFPGTALPCRSNTMPNTAIISPSRAIASRTRPIMTLH